MATITSDEKVKERAYEIFVERGGIDGNDQDDWFKAEEELIGARKTGSVKKKVNSKNRK